MLGLLAIVLNILWLLVQKSSCHSLTLLSGEYAGLSTKKLQFSLQQIYPLPLATPSKLCDEMTADFMHSVGWARMANCPHVRGNQIRPPIPFATL